MTEVESAHETHGSFVSKATGHPLPPPDHGTPVIALFNSYRQPQNLQPIPAIPPKLGKWDQSAPAQVHTNVFTEVLRKDQQDATKILGQCEPNKTSMFWVHFKYVNVLVVLFCFGCTNLISGCFCFCALLRCEIVLQKHQART